MPLLSHYGIISFWYNIKTITKAKEFNPEFRLESQQTIICYNSIVEILENVWNMFRVNFKDIRTTLSGISIVNLNTFYTFFEYYYCCWLWTGKCLLGSLDFSVGQYYSTTLEKFLGWWFYVFSLMSVKQQRTVFRCKATLLVSYTDNNESIPASSVFITTMLITGSICEHSNHWSPCYQWSKKMRK